MPRIVIVEDQPALQASLQRGLTEEGFEVMAVGTGQAAYQLLTREPADAVLLDLMLPDGDGLSVLRELRSEAIRVPIMVITAKDAIRDRVIGLDSGADDYLVKPFDFEELLARLRAIMRRASTGIETSLQYRDLVLDSLTRRVLLQGKELDLTHRQFELLEYLLRNKNRVVSRQELARDVWKASTATWTNVIEVQINQLRKKLTGAGAEPILHTVRGVGYQLGEEP
jgi:DNA-binding response OmpR family regulator